MSKNIKMREWKTDIGFGLSLSLALWKPGSNFSLLHHSDKKTCPYVSSGDQEAGVQNPCPAAAFLGTK